MRRRQCQIRRRWAWLVVAVASVYLIGWVAVSIRGDDGMKVKELRDQAAKEIKAKDWAAAFATCNELQERTEGVVWAHQIRGEIFDRQGRLPEAFVQYQRASDLGDHVAAGSAVDVMKRMQKGK